MVLFHFPLGSGTLQTYYLNVYSYSFFLGISQESSFAPVCCPSTSALYPALLNHPPSVHTLQLSVLILNRESFTLHHLYSCSLACCILQVTRPLQGTIFDHRFHFNCSFLLLSQTCHIFFTIHHLLCSHYEHLQLITHLKSVSLTY